MLPLYYQAVGLLLIFSFFKYEFKFSKNLNTQIKSI